jgi:hypothetical protein
MSSRQLFGVSRDTSINLVDIVCFTLKHDQTKVLQRRLLD